MSKRRLILAAFLLLALAVGPMPTWADENAALQGRATNGTFGDQPLSGAEVVLEVYQGEELARSWATITDVNGGFRFEGLNAGPDWVYLVRSTYQGVTYSPGPLQYQAGQSLLNADFKVYETTADEQRISVVKAHMFLDYADSRLSVTELYVLMNPGNRTYIGRDEEQGVRWTSRFLLPADIQDLEFYDGLLGERFRAVDGGFVDTEALWPGQTSVMFYYTLDCPQGECLLRRELTYPLPSLNVLIPDVGIMIESDRLVAQGQVAAQDANYLNYVGRDLVAGETVQLRVRPTVAPAGSVGAGANTLPSLPWILLGIVISMMVLGYPFWRQHVRATDAAQRRTE
jgi:hypothetical protein